MNTVLRNERVATLPSRLVAIAVVMFLASSGIVIGSGVANATDVTFANYIWKEQNVRITSPVGNWKGGKVNLHIDADGWIAATPYGQLKRGAGSTSTILLNYTGARNQLAGGCLSTAQSSSYNSVWWNFPGPLVGSFPLTAVSTY